jgi:hypothetical protein
MSTDGENETKEEEEIRLKKEMEIIQKEKEYLTKELEEIKQIKQNLRNGKFFIFNDPY